MRKVSMVMWSELVAATSGRYAASGRIEKRRILDELVAVSRTRSITIGACYSRPRFCPTVLSVGSEAGRSGNNNGSLAEAIQHGMSQSANQTG